jgi:hypothetical protein
MAIEAAFTKKGSKVKFLWFFFNNYLSCITLVASISSIKVKNGIDLDSVIVFVIAFFIPVSFFTSSSGLTPVSGAILTTLSPIDPEEVELEGACLDS